MCRRTTCRKCHKASWSGCGAHVEQVLAGVPAEDRCRCRERVATPAAEPASNTGEPAGRSLLRRLGLR